MTLAKVPPYVLEARRIELHRRFVLLEVARQRLEGVVRRVVRLLKPRQRWIDALDRREVSRDRAELLQHRIIVAVQCTGDPA
jgi:hypothetical protein